MKLVVKIIIPLAMVSFLFTGSSSAAGKNDADTLLMKEEVKVFKNNSLVDWKIYSKSVITSPDVTKIAYVVHKDGKMRVVINDNAGPEYMGIKAGTPVFSYDSKHMAYIAKKSDKSWVIVLDGKEGKAHDLISPPIFSHDSRHCAYIAQNKNRFCVVLDGKEGPYFEAMSKTAIPIFSPDSAHFAYVSIDEKKKMNLVVDQKILSSADIIASLSYSPDSRQLAYAEQVKNKCILVINERPSQGPGYDGIYSIAFSPDAKNVVCIAQNNDKSFLLKDGKEYGPYDMVATPVFFSPDSKRLIYVAKKGNEFLLIEDNVIKERSHGMFEKMLFSSDSKRFAYTFHLNDKSVMVVDNNKSKGYDAIGSFSFSRDSKHFAYKAGKGKKIMFVYDGVEGPLFDEIGEALISDDSAHYAYAEKDKDMWKVVVDGRAGLAYPFVVHPMFSPDSSHIVYLALKNDKNYVFIVDHKEGEERFDGFLAETPIVFESPISLHTIVITSGPQFALFKIKINR